MRSVIIALAVFAMSVNAAANYTSAGGIATYTTSNGNSYICPASTPSGLTVVCAIAEYPDSGPGHESTVTLTCPSGTTISCFLFASHGSVGGSCEAPYLANENPQPNSWDYAPAAALNGYCVGNNSCSLTLGVTADGNNGTINGIADAVNGKAMLAKAKFLAVCASSTPMPPSPPTPSPPSPAPPTPQPVATSGATHQTSVVCMLMVLLLATVVFA